MEQKYAKFAAMPAIPVCTCGRNNSLGEGPSERSEPGGISAHQFFHDHGVAIADWARAHGHNPRLVYAVLSGTRKCLRGKSHQIAKELGMK